MTVTDRIMDLSLIWKQAATVFPYFDRCDLDWDQLYREYLPKVVAAESELAHYLLLAEFLNHLGDGHTDVSIPRKVLDEVGYLPFSLIYLRGSYYVDGEQVLSMNGRPLRELLDAAFCYIYHVGDYAYPKKLHQIIPCLLRRTGNTLETTAGIRSFDLIAEKPVGKSTGNGVFMEVFDDILYVKLDNFLYDRAAQQIRQMLERRGPFKGVLLDIRENIGGMTMYGARVAELFISGRFHGCRKHTRLIRGNELGPASQVVRMTEAEIAKLIANGFTDRKEVERSRKIQGNAYCEEYLDAFGAPEQEARFDGPVVLLTSRNTISAAEDFAAFFRSNHRATIIGTPTCGTTGTPLIQPLSAGSVRICTVGYRLLDGTEFIGEGIQPDIYVEPEIDDVMQGRDVVLARALDCLR